MNMKAFGSSENTNEFSYVNWAHSEVQERQGTVGLFCVTNKKNGNL